MSGMSINPLLDFTDLPLFDQVQPEHVAPAVQALLADADKALETVTQPEFPSRWADIARVLDTSTENLGRAWGVVSHLNGVADTPELRAAYNEALPRVTDFWTRLGSDERLYAKYKAIDPATLNAEQRQAHKNAIRNFVLGGAELTGAARERFAAIQERQAELSQKFSENALDATDAFAYYATEAELAGVPRGRGAGRARRRAGRRQGRLQAHAQDAQLPAGDAVRPQQRAARAHVPRLRHARQRPGRPEVRQQRADREILALRQEEARLLGYRNFGEVSLVPKMADSPQQVIDFLRDLATARPALCRKGRGRHARLRRRQAGHHGPAGLGLVVHRREAQGRALRLQRAGGQAILHRAQGAGRAVQDHRDPVRGDDPPRRGAGVEPRRRVLPHRARAARRRSPVHRAGRPVLPGPGGAHRQARRRLDGRRPRALAAPRQRPAADARWRTWCAISPKAWTASRRCSRTTTSSPCSTSRATACTTC